MAVQTHVNVVKCQSVERATSDFSAVTLVTHIKMSKLLRCLDKTCRHGDGTECIRNRRQQTQKHFEALMELVEQRKQDLKEAYDIINRKNGKLTFKIGV